jgi:hypothetical protein
MTENKEAIPTFSNSTDHLSNHARPNSEFKVQRQLSAAQYLLAS